MRLGLYGQDIYYYAIMIGSSTYVGMITFGGQEGNAGMEGIVRYGDQGGGQPARDRLVRAKLPRKESYKRRREEKSTTWYTIDKQTKTCKRNITNLHKQTNTCIQRTLKL